MVPPCIVSFDRPAIADCRSHRGIGTRADQPWGCDHDWAYEPDRWLRIGLTYLVPYVVATYGVVSAVREQEMLQRIAAKKGKT